PIICSKIILHRKDILGLIANRESYILDCCFSLMIYIAIALNRDFFLSVQPVLFLATIVILLSTFGMSYLIKVVCSFLCVEHDTASSVMLLGTLKDSYIATGIAIYLFPPESAVPAIIYSWLLIIYLFWLRHMRHLL
ncbi:MAG: hypothetical protein WCJ49_01780, partial [Deltaproteobacteria bacterium]